jgi:hypothetical protein
MSLTGLLRIQTCSRLMISVVGQLPEWRELLSTIPPTPASHEQNNYDLHIRESNVKKTVTRLASFGFCRAIALSFQGSDNVLKHRYCGRIPKNGSLQTLVWARLGNYERDSSLPIWNRLRNIDPDAPILPPNI